MNNITNLIKSGLLL